MDGIERRPQQNLQDVQADSQTGEPHHEHGGTPGAERLRASRKMRFGPLDETCHPCTLHAEREHDENDRRTGLA